MKSDVIKSMSLISVQIMPSAGILSVLFLLK